MIKAKKGKNLTEAEKQYVRDNYGLIMQVDIAKNLNRSLPTISSLIKRENMKKVGHREFAIYKGDEYMFTGTRKQCLQYLNIKSASFDFLMSKAYAKRADGNHTIVVDIGIWRTDK